MAIARSKQSMMYHLFRGHFASSVNLIIHQSALADFIFPRLLLFPETILDPRVLVYSS